MHSFAQFGPNATDSSERRPALMQCAMDAPGGPFVGMIDDYRERHQEYCDRHGYDFVTIANEDGHEIDLTGGYFRFDLIRQLMLTGRHDYIFYLDADCIVTRTEKDMRDTLPHWAWLAMCVHPFPDTEDVMHYQSGVMYWRVCDEAITFLDRLLKVKETREYVNDQCALHGLMNTEERWQAGLFILPFPWNNTFCNGQPPAPIVAAFHGALQPPQRRAFMWNWAKQMELTGVRKIGS